LIKPGYEGGLQSDASLRTWFCSQFLTHEGLSLKVERGGLNTFPHSEEQVV
jgi:hypothetical protein